MTSWIIAVSRPSSSAPSATRCRVSGRKPIAVESWRRVSSRRTGRPARRAASAASVTCGQVRSAEPNAPPTKGLMTRTFVSRDAEAAGDLVPLVVDPLRLAPQRQPVALPLRDGGVRLHRVVLLARREIGRVNADGRSGEGRVGVASAGLRAAPFLGGRFGGGLASAGSKADARRGIRLVGDADERCRVQSLRLRRCDHERNGLAAEQDDGVLEHPELVARHRVDRGPLGGRLIGQPVGVQVRQHEQHARRAPGRYGVDCGDASGRDRAVMRRRVGEAVGMELGRIGGSARYLGGSVDPGKRRADRAHASAPVSVSARATVRRMSSTL